MMHKASTIFVYTDKKITLMLYLHVLANDQNHMQVNFPSKFICYKPIFHTDLWLYS